jgi:hypothetical protein
MPRTVKRQQRTDGTGISNHPLDEEIRRQDMLPARGRRRSGRRGTDRPTEPAPARRRGRGEGSDQDVPVSTRADSTVSARAAIAGYGQHERLGSPANPEFTKTTAAPGTKTSARKHNRRMRSR